MLMEREVKFLGKLLGDVERPFVAIIGGAKVSDKILVIDRLLEKADTILIGGAMAYTFRLAQGHKTGKSLVEADKTDTANSALAKAKEKKCEVHAADGRRGRHPGQNRQAGQKRQAGH